MYDSIIIGGGPAGMSAAVYMARRKLNFALLTGELGGQVLYSTEIENYLGIHEVTGVELLQKFQEHLEDYRKLFDIFEQEKATRVKQLNGGFQVFTEKNAYQTKTLLIATGAKHRKLKIPGEAELDGKGVTYCSTCDAPIYQGKTVAVVGGGNSAMEAALLAAEYSDQVHLLVLDAALKGEDALKQKVNASEKIRTHFNAKTTRILGEEAVTGVIFETEAGEETLEVQGVFIEIGLVPVSGFIDFVEKNKKGEIIVDKMNRTSVEGVWAAGDVTDISEKQIAIAVGEGCKASLEIIRHLQKQS